MNACEPTGNHQRPVQNPVLELRVMSYINVWRPVCVSEYTLVSELYTIDLHLF